MTDCRVAASLGIFGAGTGAACLGDLEVGAVQRGGRENMESIEGENWEQELLIDGLWLAYIIRDLGWAPELIWARQEIASPDSHTMIVKKNRFERGGGRHRSLWQKIQVGHSALLTSSSTVLEQTKRQWRRLNEPQVTSKRAATRRGMETLPEVMEAPSEPDPSGPTGHFSLTRHSGDSTVIPSATCKRFTHADRQIDR